LGRNESKLQALASQWGVSRWSTNLPECLADAQNLIYFDAQATPLRVDSVRAALRAGKHVYCEKPLAPSVHESLELARIAAAARVKNVVQDKLFCRACAN
jgi:predicted dehydrogenase